MLSVVSPTLQGLPPELLRMVVSDLDTPSMLLCLGVFPVLSAVVAEELRRRQRHYLSSVADPVDELLELMRTCHAILIGQAAMQFILQGPSPTSYTFTVPHAFGDQFIEALVARFGFRKGHPRPVGDGDGMYCTAKSHHPYPGLESVVSLSRPGPPTCNDTRLLVGITGTESVPGVASLPVGFMTTTLLFNYMTADGLVLGYPSLTLRLRSLFHVGRARTTSVGAGSMVRTVRMGVDFRTRPDNWDLDAHGNVRTCLRSWVAPCVRRTWGDRGCLVVSFDGTTVDALGPGWVWGGAARCSMHSEYYTCVHMPACTC